VRFYVLLALLAVLLGTGEKLARAFSQLAVAMATLWLAITLLIPSGSGPTPANLLRVFGLAPYLPFFAFGILLFMRRKQAMATDLLLVLNGAAMIMVVAVQSFASSYVGPASPVDALTTMLVFAGLMVLFLRFADRKPLPSVPLIGPFLSYAGLLSYSWYLLHETLGLTLMSQLGPYLPPEMNAALAVAATLLLAAVFSWAVEWRFRKPVEAVAFSALSLLPNLPARPVRPGPAE